MKKKKKETELQKDHIEIDFIADCILMSDLLNCEVELLQNILKKLTVDHHQEIFEDVTVDALKKGIVRWKKIYGAKVLEHFLKTET